MSADSPDAPEEMATATSGPLNPNVDTTLGCLISNIIPTLIMKVYPVGTVQLIKAPGRAWEAVRTASRHR